MTLYEYLQRTKIRRKRRTKDGVEIEEETNDSRYTRFGKKIGVSLYSVRKYINGERGIKDKTKRRIVQVTEGNVDWHDLVQE